MRLYDDSDSLAIPLCGMIEGYLNNPPPTDDVGLQKLIVAPIQHILCRYVLTQFRNNRRRTAETLGISSPTLRTKLLATNSPLLPTSGNPIQRTPLYNALEKQLQHYFETLQDHPGSNLYQLLTERAERILYDKVLQHTKGNIQKSALILRISSSTLKRRLALYQRAAKAP